MHKTENFELFIAGLIVMALGLVFMIEVFV
jgi:hypothetical protein